jgi:hypothetical protein
VVDSTRAKLALRDRFQQHLHELASHRNERSDVVDTEHGVECGWMVFERQGMLAAVNQARAERGLLPADPAAVRRAENMACGHVDYAAKFALYCAELALGYS